MPPFFIVHKSEASYFEDVMRNYIFLGCLIMAPAAFASGGFPVEFDLKSQPYTIDDSMTKDEITTKLHPVAHSQEIVDAMGKGGKAAGTITYTLTHTVKIDSEYSGDKLTINHVRVNVHFNDLVVHVASDVNDCYREKAITHEATHINFRLNALHDAQDAIANAVSRALDGFQDKPVIGLDSQALTSDMYGAANKALNNELATMNEEVMKQDESIDNIASYTEMFNSCR